MVSSRDWMLLSSRIGKLIRSGSVGTCLVEVGLWSLYALIKDFKDISEVFSVSDKSLKLFTYSFKFGRSRCVGVSINVELSRFWAGSSKCINKAKFIVCLILKGKSPLSHLESGEFTDKWSKCNVHWHGMSTQQYEHESMVWIELPGQAS